MRAPQDITFDATYSGSVADDPEGARAFAKPQPPTLRSVESTLSFGRLGVAVVLSVIIAIGAFAGAVGQFSVQLQQGDVPDGLSRGPLGTFIGHATPSRTLVLAALLAIVGIAALAVLFESVAALMSVNPRRRVLSAHRGHLRAAEAGPVRVTVLIPAHNEEHRLPDALASLAAQTRVPEHVIVVADNCTDGTVAVARALGAEVFETHGNTHRKAGALNQVLDARLPGADAADVVLVMDADTTLAPRFVEVAASMLAEDAELTAVGGVFFGEPGLGLLGILQRNEYARYSAQIRARRGRVFVLTGTASMFRAEALLDVAAARGVFIPGAPGRVYDTAALTEDNELTLALKSLGGTMVSPAECAVRTEIMPTWRALWVQRKRWQRGALENLSAYGFTRATIRYWGQQVAIGYGAIALGLAVLLFAITIASIDHWVWYPFWMAIGSVFIVERVFTVWREEWRERLVAALLVPELCFDVFQQIVFYACIVDIALARGRAWGHVQQPARTTS